MPFRTRLARTIVATAIAIVALVSVGLTAPAESPFTIDIEPVFMRLDPTSIAESQAHAIAVTVHVKLGTVHLHYHWSAIPLTPMTTKPGPTLL